jgi:pantothenate kinase
MLVFDIGPVYIKSAIIFEENEQLLNKFTSLLNTKPDSKDIFDLNLSIKYKNYRLYFFKINLFKIEEFKSSKGLEIISEILKEKYKNINNNVFLPHSELPLAYYCGLLSEKVANIIFETFNVKCVKIGHLNQLSILGIDYISQNLLQCIFDLPGQSIYDLVQVGHKLNEVTQKNYANLKDSLYPYLMANVLEGTSIYRVDSPDKFTRVGGTSFGATTYWSLVSLTCGYDDPEKAVKDAIKGNNELIDLSVGDIYGGTYEQFQLNSSLIASSFGKLKNISYIKDVRKEDISRSLLTLMCVTISLTTALIAKNSGVNKVILVGNPFECLEFMQMIQMATNYASGESVNSYFSDYAPYINLIGMCRQLELENICLE